MWIRTIGATLRLKFCDIRKGSIKISCKTRTAIIEHRNAYFAIFYETIKWCSISLKWNMQKFENHGLNIWFINSQVRPNSRPTARNRFYGRNKNYLIKGNKRGAQTLFYYFAEVESRTQPSRLRTQKKSEAKNTRRKRSPPPKKYPKFFFQATSRKKISFQIFGEVFADFPSNVKKKGHVHGSFLTKQKKCCPRAEDRTFSRTCGLQGQRLQNVSLRLRTPSRTPFLPPTEVKK